MRIDPRLRIGGRPAIEVREILRRLGEHAHDLMGVMVALEVSPMEAHRRINFLYLQGFLERDPAAPDQLRWIRTWEGQDLADAYVARPLSRGAVEQLHQEILDRVHEVNRNPRFRYQVTQVGVLEGYRAEGAPAYGLDLAVTLSVKEPDPLGSDALPALPNAGRPSSVRPPRRGRSVRTQEATEAFLRGGRQDIEFSDLADRAIQKRARIIYPA